MNIFTLLLIILLEASFAQERIVGISLEEEFTTLTETRLPLSYSSINGLSFNYFSAQNDVNGNDDNFYSDFSGLTVNFGPTGNALLERSKRYISLDSASSNTYKIEAANENSPYILIENKNWDLGAGIEAYHYLIPDRLIVGGSASILRGKNYYSVKILSHKNEKRPALDIPYNLNNLRNWKVGDQLFYASRGGIITNLYVGVKPILSFGPEYVHYGSYRIRAQLISKDKLEVEFTTTKTDSISFELSSTPFSLEFLSGQSHLNTLTYEFDINSPEAILGIQDLFHGRLDLTNQKIQTLHGKIKVYSKIDQNFVNFSNKFGLPIIYSNGRSRGNTFNTGNIEIEVKGENKKFDIISYSESKDAFTRGFVSDKKWLSQNQTTTILRGSNVEISLLGSSYSWSFSKLRMKEGSLKKKLSKIAFLFNKPILNKLEFPTRKLGYLKTEIGIGFSSQDILFLNNLKNLETLNESALQFLENDFVFYGHRSFCPLRRKSLCLQRVKNEIKYKINQLKSNIELIKSSYQENNLEEVSKNLTRSISILLSSRYLTQSYFNLRKKINIELILEGEKIKKHRFSL